METLAFYRRIKMATVLNILDDLEEKLDQLEVTGDTGRLVLEVEIRKCMTVCLGRLIPSDRVFFYAKKYHISMLAFGSDNADWVHWVNNWGWDISAYQPDLFYIFTKPEKTKRWKQLCKQ